MSLKSLIATGTKLWLDSVDPDLVVASRAQGATGATSNPIIVADLINSGRFDADIQVLFEQGLDDESIAWQLTDSLVQSAQDVFLPVWNETSGDDGYVSFELDPMLEDEQNELPDAQRIARYIELGKHWSAGHKNRMIKVPATPAGISSLEPLAAAGVTLNVTLVFTPRQYQAARNAIWRGAQQRSERTHFKSVYSIFVSRVDVYTEKHVAGLSESAQGMVGIVNAKRIWADNKRFWSDKECPLAQEIVFASTGTKKADDPPEMYVKAFAGSDIETNPPATNDAVHKRDIQFDRQVDVFPTDDVLNEIDAQVDMNHLESILMAEGVRKFAEPQKDLLSLISRKRAEIAA